MHKRSFMLNNGFREKQRRRDQADGGARGDVLRMGPVTSRNEEVSAMEVPRPSEGVKSSWAGGVTERELPENWQTAQWPCIVALNVWS